MGMVRKEQRLGGRNFQRGKGKNTTVISGGKWGAGPKESKIMEDGLVQDQASQEEGTTWDAKQETSFKERKERERNHQGCPRNRGAVRGKDQQKRGLGSSNFAGGGKGDPLVLSRRGKDCRRPWSQAVNPRLGGGG